MYKNLAWIQRYNCTLFYCYCLLRHGFLDSEAISAAPSELLNGPTRSEDCLTGHKMSLCYPTFCGLCQPPFLWGPLFAQTCWTCLNPPLHTCWDEQSCISGKNFYQKKCVIGWSRPHCLLWRWLDTDDDVVINILSISVLQLVKLCWQFCIIYFVIDFTVDFVQQFFHWQSLWSGHSKKKNS